MAACESTTRQSLSPISPSETPTPSQGAPSTPLPSTSTPSPTVSPSAWPELTVKGEARRVVDELVRTAALPVLKVDITATTATLAALTPDKKVNAWRWEQGQVKSVESDIAYIQQTPFDPADFDIEDVGALFTTAGEISGSVSGQELQIVEQTPGSVLMVVTTRPESEPIFFRPDGTLVNRLDFATREGLDEALDDVIAGRTQLTRVELTKDMLWAESSDATTGGTLRVSRPRRVPAFRTSRTDAPDVDPFSPTDIPRDVIRVQMTSLPGKLDKPQDTPVTWVMDRRDGRPLPTIRFTVGDKTIVTDLTGRDITHDV